MGYYINPRDQSKENWLMRNNVAASTTKPAYASREPDCHFVVLVNNGAFTAAGIAYNEDEFDAFSEPGDPRPKLWLQVPDEKLIAVCPEVAGVLNATE